MFKFFKVKTEYENRVQEYLVWKLRYSEATAKKHADILHRFAARFNYKSIAEVKIEDIDLFYKESIQNSTPYTSIKVMEAIRGFLRYFWRLHIVNPDLITNTGIRHLQKEMTYVNIEDMANEKLEKEAEELSSKFKVRYTVRECLSCKTEFVAATTGKKCNSCMHKSHLKNALGRHEGRKVAKSLKIDGKCIFCEKTEYIEIHHVDKDKQNNDPKNLLALCKICHSRLHSKIYNPLLKRVFVILSSERYSYEAIGDLFSTTRQNVYKILKTP